MRRCAAAAALSRSPLPPYQRARRPYRHLSVSWRRLPAGRTGPSRGEMSATIAVGFLQFFFHPHTHFSPPFHYRVRVSFTNFASVSPVTACHPTRTTPSCAHCRTVTPPPRPSGLTTTAAPPPTSRAIDVLCCAAAEILLDYSPREIYIGRQ